jgi:hypothetical protein
MKLRIFWNVVSCSELDVDRRFRGACRLHQQGALMEAARTSETSVDNYFTPQYIPEDSELHNRLRENLKSQKEELLCRSVAC